MLLLVGLGNPGRAYAKHRHNIGFMAVEKIAERRAFEARRDRFQGAIHKGRLADRETLIFKPMTSMNLCGPAVAAMIRQCRAKRPEMVVFHDELDLPLGKMRMKQGGSSAGHNGLRSLQAHIRQDFRRARLGIGHPGHAALVSGHVLGDFGAEEKERLQSLLEAIASHADLLGEGKDSSFANKIHLAMEKALSDGL